MKKFLLFILGMLLSIYSFSQIKISEITFVVRSTSVDDSESVFIAGSDPQLGDWNPAAVNLVKINDSTWSKSFKFAMGKYFEFKFTKGSWDKEALNDEGYVPNNFKLTVLDDTTITVKIKKWKDKEQRINHGQITGRVKYYFQLGGNGLKPRDILVWLPPSYKVNTDKRYPVIYMHDGQNVFDPATSSFGYDWRADEVADSLIKAGTINEIIIVAIYNTSDRQQEYTYSNLGYTYMDFVVNKLKPLIDNDYRTLSDKENTAVCGSSLGGLISFMLVWNYPQVFSKAACLSSAFKIDELNYVDSAANYTGIKKDIKLYIDNGGIGLDAKLQPGNDEMIVALQNKGYEFGKDIIWYKDKNAAHSEIAWAERIWRPLVFFFGSQ